MKKKLVAVLTAVMMTAALAACGSTEEATAEEVVVEEILNKHKYVDLGLPSGTLWATCNVGAKRNDANVGKYFSWNNLKGNTDDKFKRLDTTGENCPSPNETLSLDNDAARIHMGGKWHMPIRFIKKSELAKANRN